MYPFSSTTMELIASLVFSPASELKVRIMDVGQQSNGSDCGILAIAIAFDICCGKDPCRIRFDHKSIDVPWKGSVRSVNHCETLFHPEICSYSFSNVCIHVY